MVKLAAVLLMGLTAAAQCSSATLKVLYSFTGQADGGNPQSGLVKGNGVLYGTTYNGGASYSGTVFSLTPPASPGGSWTETVLHSFVGYPSDGANPYGGLVLGSDGTLYGTTFVGGASDFGTVFALQPPVTPGGPWTETVLYSFVDGDDGALPRGALVISDNGELYGTTASGGGNNSGTVFALNPPVSPGASWSETVLYRFIDGDEPIGGVAIGSGGVLYGTTSGGGASHVGTVFALAPPSEPGAAWKETVLHSFAGVADGNYPAAGLLNVSGPQGASVLFGTTSGNGSTGTVFVLTPPTTPGGSSRYAVLYHFTGGIDGGDPLGALVIGKGGVLYGTTYYGGAFPDSEGTVFSLAPPTALGGSRTEGVLHSFSGFGDGGHPAAGLVMDQDGVLYGTTYYGGAFRDGEVFALLP